MLDARAYPALAGTTRAHWAPIDLMPPERAVAFLSGQGRAWEAELYQLATRLRRGHAHADDR